MNTVQLTLLWYGGLAVVTVLLFTAMERGVWYSLAAIVTLTALAVYTFSPSVKAAKRWVAVFVAGPAVLLPLLFYAWEAYSVRQAVSLIRTDEVNVTDEVFEKNSWGFVYSGKIKNRSKYRLTEVTLEFIVRESGDVIERGTISIYLSVPPGEVRDFKDQRVPIQEPIFTRLVDGARNKNMKLEILVRETKGARK